MRPAREAESTKRSNRNSERRDGAGRDGTERGLLSKLVETIHASKWRRFSFCRGVIISTSNDEPIDLHELGARVLRYSCVAR